MWLGLHTLQRRKVKKNIIILNITNIINIIVARVRRYDENIHSYIFVLSKNMANVGRQVILFFY
jgi:hypothetical protein